MCGIAGIFNLVGEPLGADSAVAFRMSSALVHRGPDDYGEMTEGPVAFGFRRLSIIDLETGHQPISNETGTVWVMFNGEVYNFIELRAVLESHGYIFRTKSDTEVILHAYEHYGLDFVHHLRGMFAIALWDGTQKRLLLVRDRVGKKPLFYGVSGKQLAFASEIKALLRWPRLDRSIDAAALDQYLGVLYVPAPHSIFAGVRKLPAGHMLVADCRKETYTVERYWRVAPVPEYGKPLAYYAEGLREVLAEAVRIRLRSDVSLGAFLSGGIDSTIIVGLMAREVSQLQTFSISFPDKRFDESAYARLAAASFGTKHHEETVDSADVDPKDLEKLVWYMDEPFGDSSFIPTHWVSKIARKKVTVALSGDGGDELFGGYTRYRHFQTLQRLRALPGVCRLAGKSLASGLRVLAGPLSSTMAERLRLAQKAFELSTLDENKQIEALQTYFDAVGRKQIYTDAWGAHVNGNGYRAQTNGHLKGIAREDAALLKFMTKDFETGMIDDGLVKVDRASMACSLEVRSPFLDHKVIEFAMKIPPQFKLKNGLQKIVLKEAFKDLLPPAITRRAKQGFEVPFAQWFQKNNWRCLLQDMLAPDRLRRQGIFDSASVVNLRDQFLRDPEARGLSVSAYQLRHRVWALLMFQMWHDQFAN
jgi:asparagine synthase (glutamine-hydrolysing)